jgi:hypothetical protein
MCPFPVWCGHNEQLPGPDDLKRSKQLTGHLVQLGDGQEWLIPIARSWAEEDGDIRYRVELPRRVGLDEDGEWQPGEVSRRYTELWAVAEQHMQGMEYGQLNDGALCALQTNYAIGKYEQDALGLFEDDSVLAVLSALNDLPGYQEIVKKKAMSTKSKK